MARPPSMSESLPGVWRSLRHFAPYARHELPLVAGAMTALLASVLLRLAEPWPLKFVLDRVIPVDRPVGLHSLPVVEAMDPRTLILSCAVALVLVALLRAWCDFHRKVGFAQVGNRVLRRVRDEVFTHVQRLSVAFHARARSGDLLVRVTRDVSLLRDVTSTALLPMLANVLVLAGMATVMLVLQWQLALLAMATVPVFAFATVKIGRGIHEAARKQRQREGAMASIAAESIGGIESVQALGLEDAFRGDFSGRNAESQKEDMKAARLSAKLGRTVDIMLAVATALVLGYGAHLVTEAQLTPGDLVLFLTYLKRAFNPAKDFAKYAARLAKAAAAGERVLALLEEEPDVQDRPAAVAAPRLTAGIEFEQVAFAYPGGGQVLRDFTLGIAAGQTLALVGPSGIGKSTVLSMVSRLHDPVEGAVLIDGYDIRDFTLASLRAQVSVVLQETVLFSATVHDNIAHGVPDATRAEVEAAARLAGASEFIVRLPGGYDAGIGERGATLSKGQRQRISIARAALRDTPILLLDEPTVGLDESGARLVTGGLRRLAAGRTTLLVTHDLELAAAADVVAVLAEGRVGQCGEPAEVLTAVRREGGA